MDQWDLARTRLRRGPWNDETVNDIPQNMDPGKAAGQAAVEAAVAGPEAVDVLPELPDTQYDAGKVVVLSTNNQAYRSSAATDAWTLDVEGPPQPGHRSFIQRGGLYNGDWSLPPADTTAPINQDTNPLDGWTFTDNSSGSMVLTWVADASLGSGAHLNVTVSAGADTNETITLTQHVPVRSGYLRNEAILPHLAVEGATESSTGDLLIGFTQSFLEADEATATGSSTTVTKTFTGIISNGNLTLPQTSAFVGNPSAAAFYVFSIVISRLTDATVTGNAQIAEAVLQTANIELVLPDQFDGSNAVGRIKQSNGSIAVFAKGSTTTPLSIGQTALTTLIVPTATSPSQTTDGSMVWDSDDDHLTVGTGASRVTMLDTGSSTYATPSLTLGTANAAGAATTVIRSDATILAFDATTPAAVGTAAVGVATVAARRDHVHATGAGTPASVSTANATGTGPAAAMTDHVHAHETAHVAHDTIWDAAGDLVQGTGSDTAAKLAISVPAANILNVVGVANGETSWSVKSVHDSTAPTTSALGDAAAAGTSLLSAHRDHTHGRESFGTTTAAVGTSAGGSATTPSKSDHVHATGAGTPTTSAVGDAAATGAGPAAAMTNHVHGRESFGSTAAAIGTSAGGSATTPSKSDHVHATGAGTPSTQALGDAAATGSGPAAAMTDHKHAMPTAAITTSGLTIATATVAGRATAGTGAIEALATTGSGSVVLATSPTLVTPVLGTPTSGTLTNATGLPLSGIVNINNSTIVGNNSGGSGPPLALTAAQVRTLLALVIGTNVQAWDADLDTLAAATVTQGGTWTPALSYATAGTSSWATTTAVGWYSRLLDRIIFHGLYQGVPTNGTASGNLQLTGLPVASQNTTNNAARVNVDMQGWTKATYTQISGNIIANSSQITFRAQGSGVSAATLATGDIPTGGTVIVGVEGHYMI